LSEKIGRLRWRESHICKCASSRTRETSPAWPRSLPSLFSKRPFSLLLWLGGMVEHAGCNRGPCWRWFCSFSGRGAGMQRASCQRNDAVARGFLYSALPDGATRKKWVLQYGGTKYTLGGSAILIMLCMKYVTGKP